MLMKIDLSNTKMRRIFYETVIDLKADVTFTIDTYGRDLQTHDAKESNIYSYLNFSNPIIIVICGSDEDKKVAKELLKEFEVA